MTGRSEEDMRKLRKQAWLYHVLHSGYLIYNMMEASEERTFVLLSRIKESLRYANTLADAGTIMGDDDLPQIELRSDLFPAVLVATDGPFEAPRIFQVSEFVIAALLGMQWEWNGYRT